MDLNILGTKYTLTVKKYDEDPYFKENSIDGYCDDVLKEIAVCKMSTYPGFKKETAEYCKMVEKQIMRHIDIILRFFLSKNFFLFLIKS